ncbi:hypothetical protein C8R47DRAFT_1082554 [Mycena vitilis]|nr:hypothetical protein C8R47DRAFT_1082554 [Mycena vitilis]
MSQAATGSSFPKYVFGTFHTPAVAAEAKTEERRSSVDDDAMDTDSDLGDERDRKGKPAEDGTEQPSTAPLIPDSSHSHVNVCESLDSEPRARHPGPRGLSVSPLSSLTSASSSSYHDALSTHSCNKPSEPSRGESSTETADSRAGSVGYHSTRNSPKLFLDDSDSDAPPPLVKAAFGDDEPLSDDDESFPSSGSQACVIKFEKFTHADDKGNSLVLHNGGPAATAPATSGPATSGTSASGPALTAPAASGSSVSGLNTVGPTTNVNHRELEAHLGRIVRAPPSPSNHNWTLTQEWTRKHGAFLARVYSAQNNDALSFLKQADGLVRRHPEILDLRRMRANLLVDTDVVNTLLHPYVSKESCAKFAERIQRIRDTISAYSPGLLEPDAIHDILYIPVSADGNRLRQLSDRAFRQALMYRYAILLIARQHPEWIAFYTELRNKMLAFIHYLNALFRRRNWDLDETLLHQLAPIPPPYLHLHEYSRLRILNYTFAAHGQSDVVREIDSFLRYRFRETEVVAHLLYAGLFEPNDVVRDSDGSFKAVTHRKTPASYRASPHFPLLFRHTYQLFQGLQQANAASRA